MFVGVRMFEELVGKYIKVVYSDNDKIFGIKGTLKEIDDSFLKLIADPDQREMIIKIEVVERMEEVKL